MCPIGKASFAPTRFVDNARAVIDAVAKSRPSSAKGTFIHSCTHFGDHEPAGEGGCARIPGGRLT